MKYVNGTLAHAASRNFGVRQRNRIHKAGFVFVGNHGGDFTCQDNEIVPTERTYSMIKNGDTSTIKTHSELIEIANS